MNPQLQTVLKQVIQAFQSENFHEADLILDEVLQHDITSAAAIFELGIAYVRASRFSEASAVFTCLQLYINNDVRIPYNLGLIHSLQGRHQLALVNYDFALKIQPDDVEVLINKASTCNDIKNYGLALETLEKAAQIKPDIPELWSNKGIAFNNLNLYHESINAYNEATKLDPNYYEAWSNKSAPLNKLKRLLEASEVCDVAISLKPDYAEAWSNKGVTLNELKRYDEAIAHYDKAISLKPDYAEAWSNKGVTLNELKRYDKAISHYSSALKLKPGIDWVHGSLLELSMKICDWSGLADLSEKITQKLMANEKVSQPFSLLALNDDPLLHKQSSEIFVKGRFPYNSSLGAIPRRPKVEKIRIGYYSADFYNHATGYLMAELFEMHDKQHFELVGFSFGPTVDDAMRQRLERSFDNFIEVSNKSDVEIAQLARDLNIDIAVDLKGFTKDSRTGIFSYRAAPIQVNYLGYPGTMGADYIDYIIADRILIPPCFAHYYSEKIVSLPDSYQPNDRKRIISDRQFTRQELGLPESGFVFCCFNNNLKILPDIFTIWMRILNSVKGSVLWLFEENSWAIENIKKTALSLGIDEGRLIFARQMELSEHLSRHHQADLFLDTFPYNAHTTASDALWAGVPIITLIGQSFASRVAASLLNAIGLPELITNSQEEYEALAIELAMNPDKFADLKQKLAINRMTTPLFDTPLFTKNLEAAYIKMYERYQADLQPDHIVIN